MLKKFVKAAGFGLKHASEEFPVSELLNMPVALMRPLAEPLLRTFFITSVSLLDAFLCNSEIKTLPELSFRRCVEPEFMLFRSSGCRIKSGMKTGRVG